MLSPALSISKQKLDSDTKKGRNGKCIEVLRIGNIQNRTLGKEVLEVSYIVPFVSDDIELLFFFLLKGCGAANYLV